MRCQHFLGCLCVQWPQRKGTDILRLHGWQSILGQKAEQLDTIESNCRDRWHVLGVALLRNVALKTRGSGRHVSHASDGRSRVRGGIKRRGRGTQSRHLLPWGTATLLFKAFATEASCDLSEMPDEQQFGHFYSAHQYMWCHFVLRFSATLQGSTLECSTRKNINH